MNTEEWEKWKESSGRSTTGMSTAGRALWGGHCRRSTVGGAGAQKKPSWDLVLEIKLDV